MSKSTLVSVAMTCYNQANYIEDAIKSVVDQAYPYWEIVIVDDCSTDKSLKVINKCVDKYNIREKVNIITNKKNMGYGYSLGLAIKNSKGDLVSILDSDDALANRKSLKWSVAVHNDHPEVALTYSNYIICNKRLKQKSKYKTKQINNFLKEGGRIGHLKTIKKSYYDMTSGINPELRQTVDKDLVLKIEEVGKLFYINKELYYYRHHSDNLSRSLRTKDKKYQKLVKKMRKRIYEEAKRRRGIK